MGSSKKDKEREAQIETLADFEGFTRELNDPSPRATAVLAGAHLDVLLEQLLRRFMIDDPPEIDRLLGRGTDSLTFASKTRLAYGLGLIGPEEKKTLDRIREIRNKFAHQLHGLSFDSPAIAPVCDELDAPQHMDRRGRFLVAVFKVSLRLSRRCDEVTDAEKRTIRAEPLTIRMTFPDGREAYRLV